MTVFPARPALNVPRNPGASPAPPARTDAATTPRPGVAEWARRRRALKDARRVEAAGARALHRLDRLGPAWHIVDWPRTDAAGGDGDPGDERAGFLAIGPGGVYAVTVADHGRTRVLMAGDVVQINGRRPPYVAEARRDARRAERAISAAVGLSVPVIPVLAFVGSGVLSVHGLPKDCLVATDKELDRLLLSGGAKISAATAAKLRAVAESPSTWLNAADRAGRGRTAADKRTARR